MNSSSTLLFPPPPFRPPVAGVQLARLTGLVTEQLASTGLVVASETSRFRWVGIGVAEV